MTATLAHIWRHPIKSHGREALDEVSLALGATMPWDRTWAVAHEGARTDGSDWAPCANFSRGAKAPSLMAIEATLDEAEASITLTHPDRPTLSFRPDHELEAFLDWVAPLMPQDRAQSARILRVEGRGMTDTPFPSISIKSLASHAAVEEKLGQSLSPKRWRGNLWLDGLEPWEEFNWMGKTLRIGDAEIEIREPVTRCLATTANTETGERDADTLGALKSFGHQDFGVYGVVTKAGTIRLGDKAVVL